MFSASGSSFSGANLGDLELPLDEATHLLLHVVLRLPVHDARLRGQGLFEHGGEGRLRLIDPRAVGLALPLGHGQRVGALEEAIDGVARGA